MTTWENLFQKQKRNIKNSYTMSSVIISQTEKDNITDDIIKGSRRIGSFDACRANDSRRPELN